MKTYKILQSITLGFSALQDQFDEWITPESGAALESDGRTIWVVENGTRRESITTPNAIDYFLGQGMIEEIQPE